MKKTKNILKSFALILSTMLTQLVFASHVFATAVMVNGELVNQPVETGGLDGTFNTLFDIARSVVSGITGILSIVMVFIFT